MAIPAAPSARARPGPEPDPAWHGINPLNPDPDRRGDPFAALHHLREVAPINETPLGFWRLTRYDDCVRLLREVRCGVRRTDGSLPGRRQGQPEGRGQFMLQRDPPDHTRLRKLVSKAFTPRATEIWRARAQEIADALLARVLDAGRMDVIADLALPVPSTLICEMLGVPVADRERFTRWTSDATHALAGQLASPEQMARADAASFELARYFEGLIAERRRQRSDDLLSVLIRAEEDGDRLSPQELLVQSIGLLIAGFETTIGLIGNGVRALLRHPDELAKLRAQPGLLASAVEECLRYEGPVGATIRVLHADAEFGGRGAPKRTIPKDTEVWAMIWGANRDPARFPDPDRFDISRTDNAHLGLGGGTHMCLGAHLARMEAQVAIGALVRRTRDLALASDDISWGPSLFRVPAGLPVTFKPA